LVEPVSRRVNRQALLRFLINGLPYVFPVSLQAVPGACRSLGRRSGALAGCTDLPVALSQVDRGHHADERRLNVEFHDPLTGLTEDDFRGLIRRIQGIPDHRSGTSRGFNYYGLSTSLASCSI
jgi:hypothetical protein